LILSLVVALGVITLRQRRSNDLVALNTPAAEPGLTSATEPPVGPQTLEQQNSVTARETQKTTQEESKQEGKRSDVQAETKSNLAKAESESAAAPPPPPKSAGAVTNEPNYAPEPRTSVQPPAAQSTAATADRAEAQAKDKGEDKADAAKSRDDRDLRYDDEKDRVAAREVHNLPSVGRSGPRRSEEVSSARARKAQVVDVRTVSGREFRREGKRWIDLAYESQALTNVKRDSEQFRALTADEPQLKTITDALPGTVIVIWKGRAYRID
jgi:hypothetical protein